MIQKKWEWAMGNEIDRRVFLKSATALGVLGMAGTGCSTFTSKYNREVYLRAKKPAVVKGAFFYPPTDVVLRGEFEDWWQKEKWCTWPGNQFEPEAQQAKFMKQVKSICNGLDIRLAIKDKSIYSSAGIENFIEEVKSSKPDALLLFNFWNTLSAKLKPVLDSYDGPIIVYHPVGASHQLPPKHFETAERVQYIHSIENWGALERGLRAVHAHGRMCQGRVLRVSGQISAEADNTEPFWGTAIHSVPAGHFNSVFDSMAVTDEMRRFARMIKSGAKKVIDLSDESFIDAARADAAVCKLMERHEADAITIECLFLKHRKPCLSFALNNGNLIPCGCENDLNATLSLMLGAGLFGCGGFQHNPEFDTEENLYFASHCTCTTKLCGEGCKDAPYLLRPFFHQAPKTPALDVQWPGGVSVTLFKYHSGKKLMDAWGGEVLYSPKCPPTGGCATRVLVKMKDVDDVHNVYPGPHPILYCGDFVKCAETYGKLYGLDVRSNT